MKVTRERKWSRVEAYRWAAATKKYNRFCEFSRRVRICRIATKRAGFGVERLPEASGSTVESHEVPRQRN